MGLSYRDGFNPQLWNALLTSIGFATVAAFITVLLALIMAYAVRVSKSGSVNFLVRLASIGYAIPGTIVALGIFLPLAKFDNCFDGIMRQVFGFSTGLLITGSGATIILAYVVRFMAMGEGSLDNGMRKITPRIDMASRSLGKTSSQTLASGVVADPYSGNGDCLPAGFHRQLKRTLRHHHVAPVRRQHPLHLHLRFRLTLAGRRNRDCVNYHYYNGDYSCDFDHAHNVGSQVINGM